MLTIKVKNWNDEVLNEIEAKSELFNTYVNEDLIAQVVRWQRAKARSGNAETQTRSEVTGTTKKSRAQKETGQSRQGSLKGPHHRGGGVVFGPHKRSYEFKLNKKIRVNAAKSIISYKFNEGEIHCYENLSLFPFVKTKELNKWLEEKNIKSPLFVLSNEYSNEMAKKVMQNIPKCDFILSKGFNVLDCLKHKEIIFDLKSLKEIENRYIGVIND